MQCVEITLTAEVKVKSLFFFLSINMQQQEILSLIFSLKAFFYLNLCTSSAWHLIKIPQHIVMTHLQKLYARSGGVHS